MPVQIIRASQGFGISVSGSDGGVTVLEDVWVLGTINEDASLHDNTITIDGMLAYQPGSTSELAGTNTRLIVGENGGIAGDAFTLSGLDATVDNHGSIFGVGDALILSGDGAQVANDGIIQGYYETVQLLKAGTVINGVDGEIHGVGRGVNVAAFASTAYNAEIINHGRIEAADAVVTGLGSDYLRNNGIILGNVSLGGGQDTFDGRGGSVEGEISLGAESDTYLISGALTLVEAADAGIDVVKSTVSYALSDNFENLTLLGKGRIDGAGNGLANLMIGNRADNRLDGDGGSDILKGGRGRDILTGGTEGDTFVFASGDGRDKIVDFELAADRLDLSSWRALHSLADLMRNHVSSTSLGVVIAAGTDSLVLEGVSIAELETATILF